MFSIGTLFGEVRLEDFFSPGLDGAQKRIDGFERRMQTLGSFMQGAGLALSAAVTVPLVAVGAAAIKFGMDAVESENLVSVSFGDMKQAADQWSKSLSDNLGLNEFELRKTAGTLFNMTTSMGLARDEAYKMSTGVAELAADMASFRNIPMEEALLKIRSGLVGETEPLKAIGILVDEATVKHEAYRIGLVEVGEELTQQQKVQARWSAILRQTANDQGDLARTIESPANQLRIMKTRLTEAATELGMSLMPLFSQFVKIVAGGVPYIQSAVEWFTELPEPVKLGAVVLGGLAAAAGPLLIVLGSLATSVTTLLPLLVPGLSGASTTAAGGLTTLHGAASRLLGVLAGPAGLVASLGALALVWQNQKIGAIEEQAAAFQKASEILGRSATTIAEARQVIEAFQKGQKGEQIKNATLEQAEAWRKGAEEAGKLGKVVTDLVIPGFGQATETKKSYTQQLREVKDSLSKLTQAQRDEIAAAQQLGEGPLKEVMTKYGLTDTKLKILTETTKDATARDKELWKTRIELAESYQKNVDAIDKWGQSVNLWARDTAWDLAESRMRSQMEVLDELTEATLDWYRVGNLQGRMPSGQFNMGNVLDSLFENAKQVGPDWMRQTDPKKGIFASVFGSAEMFGANLAETIMDSFKGGGSPIEAAGSFIGSSLSGSLGKYLTTAKEGLTPILSGWLGGAVSALLPGLGSLLGPLADGMIKVLGGLFDQNKGRDLVIKAFGDLDELRRKLNEVEDQAKANELWVALTQGEAENNPEAAKRAIQAVNDLLDEHKKKQEAAGKAAAKAAEEITAAQRDTLEKQVGVVNGLTAEYDRLWESIADEAPEEVMGVVEQQTRARMEALAEEREAAEEDLMSMTETLGEGFDDVLAKLDEFIDRLGGLSDMPPIRIPFEFPNVPEPGGVVGHDTSRLPPIQTKVYINGREAAEAISEEYVS